MKAKSIVLIAASLVLAVIAFSPVTAQDVKRAASVIPSLTLTGATALTLNNGSTGGAVIFGTNPATTGGVVRIPNNVNFLAARNAANNANVSFVFLDTNNLWNIDPNASGILYSAKAFASLGTPANGAFYYCNDCTVANPCAGAGTGAFAKRLNGAWVCN